VNSEILSANEPPRAAGLLGAGLPPTNDRMLTTIFVAALLHGILILGVTFGTTRGGADDAAGGLEVVLVNDRAPEVASNPNARYLAQRTQSGSGNTLQSAKTVIPKSSVMPVDRLGVPNGEGIAETQAGHDNGDEELVATSNPSQKILYFASPSAAEQPAELPMLMEKRPDLAMSSNDEGVELHLRGEAKKELWIAADTSASDVAVYLDAWRRKIERVGTMNFPNAARRSKLSGTPVIEVTIGANGRLLSAEVKRTSGHAEIDEAALRILKLAAPFDPFPAELTSKHDEIRIAYEWQFLEGASQGGGVFYSEPTNP
jgi:periplasmic protein TonB